MHKRKERAARNILDGLEGRYLIKSQKDKKSTRARNTSNESLDYWKLSVYSTEWISFL